MSAMTGSFSIGDSTVQMPVKAGTIGPSVVDIGKLYAQTGMFTYDPGFTLRLIGKMPTLAAMAYKYSLGQPFVYPKKRPRLFVEFPVHVLRGAVRGL